MARVPAVRLIVLVPARTSFASAVCITVKAPSVVAIAISPLFVLAPLNPLTVPICRSLDS